MKPRVFLLVCATVFGATAVLFALLAHLDGRRIDGSFLIACAFALAFIGVAVRFPDGDGRAMCGRCGRGLSDLPFCGRCGERRAH